MLHKTDLIYRPYAMDYIFGILNHADRQSPLVNERTVVGLLRLCISFSSKVIVTGLRCCHDLTTYISFKANMQEDILKCLRLLNEFPPSVTQQVAEQMMAGIFNLSAANSDNLK